MLGMGMIIMSLFLLLMSGNRGRAAQQRGFMRNYNTDDSRVIDNRRGRKHY